LNKLDFFAWLSGFIDAEGNFKVFIYRKFLRVSFRINLHYDDVAILNTIKEYLFPSLSTGITGIWAAPQGIGNVEKHANSCVFVVRDVNALLNVLIPILDKYPLRTIKYLDFLDFKKMLLFLSAAKTTAVID